MLAPRSRLRGTVNALFYHYDGSYMLVDARDQLGFGQPSFEYSNNFLQSIGNIQLPQNARLLALLVADRLVFRYANRQSRKLSDYRSHRIRIRLWAGTALVAIPAVALAAGWILGVFATPFVPVPFFYPILSVAPDYVVIIAAPVVAFWLMGRAGRSPSLFADAAAALGLVALAFYLLAAALLILPILALGMVPYIVLALCLRATGRSFCESLRYWRP